MLEVELFNTQGDSILELSGHEEAPTLDGPDGPSVDFVSIVNDETHGIPPLIGPPGPKSPPTRAAIGQKVLYINTSCAHLVAWTIVRTEDN